MSIIESNEELWSGFGGDQIEKYKILCYTNNEKSFFLPVQTQSGIQIIKTDDTVTIQKGEASIEFPSCELKIPKLDQQIHKNVCDLYEFAGWYNRKFEISNMNILSEEMKKASCLDFEQQNKSGELIRRFSLNYDKQSDKYYIFDKSFNLYAVVNNSDTLLAILLSFYYFNPEAGDKSLLLYALNDVKVYLHIKYYDESTTYFSFGKNGQKVFMFKEDSNIVFKKYDDNYKKVSISITDKEYSDLLIEIQKYLKIYENKNQEILSIINNNGISLIWKILAIVSAIGIVLILIKKMLNLEIEKPSNLKDDIQENL